MKQFFGKFNKLHVIITAVLILAIGFVLFSGTEELGEEINAILKDSQKTPEQRQFEQDYDKLIDFWGRHNVAFDSGYADIALEDEKEVSTLKIRLSAVNQSTEEESLKKATGIHMLNLKQKSLGSELLKKTAELNSMLIEDECEILASSKELEKLMSEFIEKSKELNEAINSFNNEYPELKEKTEFGKIKIETTNHEKTLELLKEGINGLQEACSE